MTPTYTLKNNKRYNYFQCLKDSKRGESICPLKRIPAGDIESAVLQQFSAVFRTPSLLAKTYASLQEAEAGEREILQKRQVELSGLLETVRKRIKVCAKTGNGDELTNLRTEFNRLNQEMFNARAQLKRMKTAPLKETDIIEALDNINALRAELFPGEQQHLMNLLVDNIVLKKDNMKMELKTANMTELVSEIINIHVK